MDKIAKRAKSALERSTVIFLRAMTYWLLSISAKSRDGGAQKKFSASCACRGTSRAWLLVFVDYIAAKKIIAPALNAMAGGPSGYFSRPTASWKRLPMRWRARRR
jgi:hypothetical protein